MKKLLGLIAGLFLLLTVSSAANAYYFEDMIDTWTVLGIDVDAVYFNQNHPLTYSHNINDSVNFAAGHLVTEAWLELDFTNDSIEIGGDTYGQFFCIKWDYREYASYGFDGNAWVLIDEIDDGQYTVEVDIDWLNDNGILDVVLRVSNPLGNADAWLDHSRLYGNAVPEPATMMLFGLGLLGLAGVSRKRK